MPSVLFHNQFWTHFLFLILKQKSIFYKPVNLSSTPPDDLTLYSFSTYYPKEIPITNL